MLDRQGDFRFGFAQQVLPQPCINCESLPAICILFKRTFVLKRSAAVRVSRLVHANIEKMAWSQATKI